MTWAIAFLLTCAVELPIVVAIAPRTLRRRASLDSLAANLLTHPLAFYLYTAELLSWGTIEVGVAVTETLVYGLVTRMPWPRAVLAALLSNGVTAAMSFLF